TGGDADPAEPVPDRRAAADGAVRLAGRAGAGLGIVGRRGRAIPLADGILRPGRGRTEAALAAADAADQADIADHGAGRARRRRHPAQSGDLDRARFAIAGWLGVLSLLCRP